VFTRIALLILIGIAFSKDVYAATDSPTKQNVLFIAVDDLRVELGCYGDTPVKTPYLDRLASRGTLFHRAYCQQSLCNPSRASLLTGLRPDSLKVWDLPTHFRENVPQIVTLPQLFKTHGYFTQDIGKIFHNYRQDQYKGDPLSWSVPAVLHYNRHSNDTAHVVGDLPTNLATLEQTECRDVPDEAYFDGRVAKQAIGALRKMDGKPFFLAVGFWKPHLPFNAPKKYWDLYDRNEIKLPKHRKPPKNCPPYALTNYKMQAGKPLSDAQVLEARHGHYAAISYLDAQVGKIIDELDRQGLRKNTVVIFWSDHGLHVGERGLWSKRTNFELDVRVPLIIDSPSHQPEQVANGLVELVDIYPTLIDLCNLPMPHRLEGKSLRPMLEDPQTKVKEIALSQTPRPSNPSSVRYAAKPPQVMGYSIRTDRFRYTEWQDFATGEVQAKELYDHDVDPQESSNVIEELAYNEELKRLSKLLEMKFRRKK